MKFNRRNRTDKDQRGFVCKKFETLLQKRREWRGKGEDVGLYRLRQNGIVENTVKGLYRTVEWVTTFAVEEGRKEMGGEEGSAHTNSTPPPVSEGSQFLE